MTGIEYREKILSYCKQKGPLLPSDVAKLLKTDTLRAGAMLSEMTESKLLIISSLKIGGSPLYYLPDQPEKLELFIGKLKDKDRGTLESLRQNKIMKDSGLDLFTRFSLRQLKDFAKPFHVMKGEEAELFWRFYTVSEKDAVEILKPKKAEQIVPPAKEERKIENKMPSERKKTAVSDSLMQKARSYFESNKFTFKEAVVLKKNKDIECVIEKDGRTFFCKVRDKKSFSDTDLAAAFGQASSKNMKAMLLITGSLTKKAAAALPSFEGLLVERLA